MALASAKGDTFAAMERAKSWRDCPEVELLVKAAWPPAHDGDLAGPLAIAQPLVDEFLELLRTRTPSAGSGLRQVPFNVASVPDGRRHGGWVRQGQAKPVTAAAFATPRCRLPRPPGSSC